MNKHATAAFSGIFLACALGTIALAAPPSVLDGAFTAEQVERGSAIYGDYCAGCHGTELVSQDPDAPNLTEPQFRFSWQKKTIAEKYERIRTTMPLGAPGIVTDQEYMDIVAFILNFNGYPTGDAELTPETDGLDEAIIAPLE